MRIKNVHYYYYYYYSVLAKTALVHSVLRMIRKRVKKIKNRKIIVHLYCC